jgi:ribosome-binding factor A
MKKPSQRSLRVADQIQRELSQLLRDEVKDPRVGRVTITGVEVSADLSHAKVFFSHLAGREHAPEAVNALQRTAGFLRSELSHRLGLYSVPQLHFAYDDSIESGMRLAQLIDDAVAADRKLEQ